eukprot:239539-Amphidinium_carterae.8
MLMTAEVANKLCKLFHKHHPLYSQCQQEGSAAEFAVQFRTIGGVCSGEGGMLHAHVTCESPRIRSSVPVGRGMACGLKAAKWNLDVNYMPRCELHCAIDAAAQNHQQREDSAKQYNCQDHRLRRLQVQRERERVGFTIVIVPNELF